MKTLVFLLAGIAWAFSTYANIERNPKDNLADKVEYVTDRTFEIIGKSLLVVNDFVFQDTSKQNVQTDSVTTKKGYEAVLKLAPKGAKVFISAEDEGVLAHTTRNIDYWHYWQIVENKKEADFTIEIKFRYGNLGRSFCYALFLNPADNEVYRTYEVDNFANADINFKRSAVNNLLDNVVKPIFEL